MDDDILSTVDSESTVSEIVDLKDCLFPWVTVMTVGALTCSPVDAGRIICVDSTCIDHDGCGRGKPDVGGGLHCHSWKATNLERLVVFSFLNVEPRLAVGTAQFEGWTETELSAACFETDCLSNTQRLLFDNKIACRKLKKYTAGFTEMAEMMSKHFGNCQGDEGDEAITSFIMEVCGGIDPILYVATFQSRMDRMEQKVNQLKNTVKIWKEEAVNMKKDANKLMGKLRYIKKNGQN